MSVYGFAKNDVYACDGPGWGVYHYDGQQWTNVYKYSNSSALLSLNNVWGDSPNDIYAVGKIDTGGTYRSAILHFSGNTWDFLNVQNLRVQLLNIRQGVNESDFYYLSAIQVEISGDTNKIFQLSGNNLVELYSGKEIATVNEMAGRIYHCIGKKIYKYQNDQLIVWKDFSGTTHLGRVWGRSEKDFFTVASDGLAHYNGSDLITIYPTSMFINEAFIFVSDIFVLCNNRIIVHGTLK